MIKGKLIFYIPSFENGGAERVASVLLNYWVKNDSFLPFVINTIPKEYDFFEIDSSISRAVLDYDYRKKGVLANIKEKLKRILMLRRTLRERPEDLVVSFLTTPSLLLLISSIGLKKKIICCEHSNYYLYGSKYTRAIRNLLYYLLADQVTLLTARDIDNYPAYLRKKVTVVPNPLGIDGSDYDCTTNSLSNGQDIIKLLFVGRLVEVKGIKRLCEILKRIKNEPWHLTICGDGPLRDYLEDFLSKNSLNDKVSLVGSVKDIERYYCNSDILVMTSLKEGLPMVIAEAMSFEVPVIAFDCPTGPREFISHNRNGLLIKDDDYESYVNQLKLVIHNRAELKRLASTTRNSIEPYRISTINMIWEDLINKLYM